MIFSKEFLKKILKKCLEKKKCLKKLQESCYFPIQVRFLTIAWTKIFEKVRVRFTKILLNQLLKKVLGVIPEEIFQQTPELVSLKLLKIHIYKVILVVFLTMYIVRNTCRSFQKLTLITWLLLGFFRFPWFIGLLTIWSLFSGMKSVKFQVTPNPKNKI